jgi:hypothetical protein
LIVRLAPLQNLRFSRVQYYTVYFGEAKVSEFIDFQRRMNTEANRLELGEINRYIERIGKEYGAQPQHFRSEDAAEALPPPYHQFIESDRSEEHHGPDFGIRLYCIRLTPSIVILLNGNRKTALKVNDCSNCYPHFDRARKLARRITQAIQDGFIELDEESKEILIEDDFDLEI